MRISYFSSPFKKPCFKSRKKVIDSWGKIPSGMLWMHLVSLGNFDECLNVTKHFENEADTINGQYCMANIPINDLLPDAASVFGGMTRQEQQENARMLGMIQSGQIGFNLGICIPRYCNATILEIEIKKSLNITLNQTIISPQNCINNDPIILDAADWTAIVVFSSMAVILLLCSIYDYTLRKQKKEKNQLLIAFSLLTNGQKLFKMQNRLSPDVIHCLDGIRCLSIVWVVFGHTFMIIVFLANINMKYIAIEWPKTLYSMLIQTATVSVDSFFLLSGLLVAWVVLKELDRSNGKLNILAMYLHRYLRLTPLLVFLILFVVSIFRYTGSGPFWSTMPVITTAPCEENWWATLLYISNYVHSDKMCLPHTWYLAVDTQLYVLSPVILIPLWKWGMKFVWIIFALMAGSIAFTFTTFMNNEYSLLMKDGLLNNETRQKLIYFPTHARAAPWLVGILLGYILHLNKGKRMKIPKLLVTLGWITSLGTILLVIFGPYHRTKPGSVATTLEGAFYESFSRVSWAIALAWIILACSKGYGGVINEFLSLSFWQPFSRLTYSIYLTHIVIEVIVSGNVKTDTHFSNFEMITRFYSDFGMTLIVSVIAVLAFESPIVGLEKLIFKRNSNEKQRRSEADDENNDQTITSSQRQLYVSTTSDLDVKNHEKLQKNVV